MKKFVYKVGQRVRYTRGSGDVAYGKIVSRLAHPKNGLPCYTIFFDGEFFHQLHGEPTNFCVLWEGAGGLGLD